MIVQSKLAYKKRFGNEAFYVVVMPNYKEYEEDDLTMFLEKLEQFGLEAIDLSNIVDYGPNYTLENDAHHKSLVNKFVGERINWN